MIAGNGYAQVPFAPNLTETQLKQLHNVSKWTITVHHQIGGSIDGKGFGGNFTNFGGQVGSWSADSLTTQTHDGTFVVSGPSGCPYPGCSVDNSSPSQVSLQYLNVHSETVDALSGCPAPGGGFSDPGTLTFTLTNEVTGSSILDGSTEPGHQGIGKFFIDYSTNPPRAESDIGTSNFIGTSTVKESKCNETIEGTSQFRSGVDLAFFFGDPNGSGTEHGGDTQVRIDQGKFIIQGNDNGNETALACVFSSLLVCDNKDEFFTVFNIDNTQWVATAPMIEGEPVITVPNSPLIAEATGPNGASVTFNASANASDGTPLSVNCNPQSGSIFPLGSTDVVCSATDVSGNTGSATFTILVQDTTPPTINVPQTIVTNATSPKGANVTYFVTATDLVDGPINLVPCVPASGNLFLIGTTIVTCTATDNHNNKATDNFDIIVKGAPEQLSDLISYISSNNIGPGTSLLSKLQAAKSEISAGSISAACGMLNAFINEAQAQSGKKLTSDQAKNIIDIASRIRTVLGC